MKKFAGFTPQQQYTLLSKQGYTGPADEASMEKFLVATPSAAAKMGYYTKRAQELLKKPMMAGGGAVAPTVTYSVQPGYMTSGGTQRYNVMGSDGKSAGEYNNVFLAQSALKQLQTPAATPAATPAETPRAPGVTYAENSTTPTSTTPDPKTNTATAPKPDAGGTGEIWLNEAQIRVANARSALNADPSNQAKMDELIKAQTNLNSAQQNYAARSIPTSQELVGTALNDPMSLVTQPEVTKIQTSPDQEVGADVGQVSGTAPTASTTKVGTAEQATAPVMTPASLVDPNLVAGQTPTATAQTGTLSDQAQVNAAEGKLSPEAMAQAATLDPKFIDKVASGQLQVGANELATAAGKNAQAIKAEVAQSNGIAAVVAEQGTVKPEELPEPALIKEEDMAQAEAITASGLAPDAIAVAARLEKFTVDNETLALAAQGDVSALDTVQGQLTELMKSFNDGATPAWAAGAIRTANAAMAARGLGGSSMAGAAVFQAAMESALPIAQQDAQVFQQMNLTNLNNRQQVALANAAAQQGLQLQNLNNEQQVALQNSANSFALQSQNLSNVQQTMLANAQIKAALQGQNLSNQQQSNIATAARFAEAANLNLNNRQQVALQNNSNNLNIELANLNNKQQAYIANAQIAASLQGKQIDNEQQAAIANAARYADAANITFTAEQQTALHNSELMKTIGLAELNTKQATTLQNAANLANMDMANLNNRQQAAVENAKAFLQMDITNLSNEQQTELFNTQNMVQTMFSDQAAENAAKQFNAASENQVNQFFAGLAESVSRFNADQKNTIAQFDAGSENATEQFNSNMKSLREQFNAQNSLLIAQGNALWRQNISTLDTAALNEANMIAAKVASGLTADGMAQFWQREKDLMSYVFTASENDANRNLSLILGDKEIEAKIAMQNAAFDFQDNIAQGELIGNIINSIF
jgi:hypothetical protein